jgi:hypothetical protein
MMILPEGFPVVLMNWGKIFRGCDKGILYHKNIRRKIRWEIK